MTDTVSQGFSTRAVHAGVTPDLATGAVMTPIYATTTFRQTAPGVLTSEWEYTRSGNPTRAALEANIAALEGGARGFAFASGLAAEATILELLPAGSHIVSTLDVYGGSRRLFHGVREHSQKLETTHVDGSDLSAIEAAIRPDTKLIWIETPGNPTLSVVDIKAVAEIAKRRGLLTVVDNTIATPRLQRPLELGADIVVHSATKFINGHSDVVVGLVVVREAGEIADRIGYLQNAIGSVLDPFSSFLVLRGVKTLAVRIDRHVENAGKVATFLKTHPAVERALYPGFPDHPGHEIAARQMSGFGALVSAYLKTDAEGTARVLSALSVFTLAESMGGVESLAGNPWTMSHASQTEEVRRGQGVTPNLIRLSVGIEDADDLIADLKQALARI